LPAACIRVPLALLTASKLLVQHFCLTLALHQREMIGMPTSTTEGASTTAAAAQQQQRLLVDW